MQQTATKKGSIVPMGFFCPDKPPLNTKQGKSCTVTAASAEKSEGGRVN